MGFPQNENLTLKEIKEKAAQKASLGDLYGAIEWFQKASDKAKSTKADPSTEYAIIHKLANLNRKIRNYRAALKHYRALHKKRSAEYPQARFYWGLMAQQTGKYQKALEVLKQVKKYYRGPDNRKVKLLTKNAIKGCRKALKADPDDKITINHLDVNINSAYTELSPFFQNDSTLIYASRKADSLITLKRGEKVSDKTRFYKATKKNGKWRHQGPWQPFIDVDANLGNGTFSKDQQRFYFTQCQLNSNKEMECKIWVSEKQANGDWSDPEKLPEPINKDGVSSTHPSAGEIQKGRRKQQLIFFTSARDKGKGGKDIWYTKYDERRDRYSNPRNAGRYVNTIGDDMTPYFDDKLGKLYFSSEGWPGYGGLDIFEVPFVSGRFKSEPENMGKPVNSPADDLYYNINNEGVGFLVSNRQGVIALKHPTCCDDIFNLKMPEGFVDHLTGIISLQKRDDSSLLKSRNDQDTSQKMTVALYKVIDSASGDQKQSEQQLGDTGKQRRLIAKDTVTDTSQYRFSLKDRAGDQKFTVEANKEGYYREESDTFTRESLTDSDNYKNLSLKPIPKEPIVIPNIYYEFDKAVLKEGSKKALDTSVLELLDKNPKLILEIRSHTDSIGDKEYNMQLSQRRAQSVVDYLTKQGVDKERLTAKGFGESRPIAPNTLPDGSDNPEGRQKNRRTEFRVIGELKGNKKVIYQE